MAGSGARADNALSSWHKPRHLATPAAVGPTQLETTHPITRNEVSHRGSGQAKPLIWISLLVGTSRRSVNSGANMASLGGSMPGVCCSSGVAAIF